MELKKINSLIEELNANNPKLVFIGKTVEYSKDEENGVPGPNFKITFKFNTDPSYPSVIELSHRFSLDVTHIEILLKQKNADINLASPERLKTFLKNNFEKIKQYLKPYAVKDYYKEIVDLMILHRGETYGGSFGI